FIPKAGPVSPTCGMVVTSSITLGADSPLCTDQPGLIIGADGVTVNLNGHRLLGDRTGAHAGIDTQGHARIAIKNGIVAGFFVGILAHGGNALKLTNVQVRDNLDAGALLDASGIAVAKSSFIDNTGVGLLVGGVAPKVTGSYFVANLAGILSFATGGVFSKIVATLNDIDGIRLHGDERATV